MSSMIYGGVTGELQKKMEPLKELEKAVVNNALNEIDTKTEDKSVQTELDNIKKCRQNTKNNIIDYLVRGAILRCDCGSHRRMLNLPVSHGVYIDSNPVMHERDCLTEIMVGKDKCNITFFGVCKMFGAGTPGAEYKVYKKTLENSADGCAGVVMGYKCMPVIVGDWNETNGSTIIANSEPGRRDKTITTISYLICKYGGIIYPIYSGQSTELKPKDMKRSDEYFDLTGIEKIEFPTFKNKKSSSAFDFTLPGIEKETTAFPNPFSK